MDKILESLLTSRVIETTQSAKDKKQKNKYPQIRSKSTQERNTLKDEAIKNQNIIDDVEVWESEERRNGTERRQEKSERGRYFESRDKGSRRIKKELNIKI